MRLSEGMEIQLGDPNARRGAPQVVAAYTPELSALLPGAPTIGFWIAIFQLIAAQLARQGVSLAASGRMTMLDDHLEIRNTLELALRREEDTLLEPENGAKRRSRACRTK